MKPFPDSTVRYHRARKLTEYDRRLLAALAQGWPVAIARNVDGSKRGISGNQARLTAYHALIKIGVDVNAQIGQTSISTWCYENAGRIMRKIGIRHFKERPHNDSRKRRLDRDLYLEIIRRKLDGQREPQIRREMGLGWTPYNRCIAFWHRLLPLYLIGEEKDLADEPFQYWQVILGYDRHKAIMHSLLEEWGEFDRPEEVYRRVHARNTPDKERLSP